MRQMLLQNSTAILLQNATEVYYKMRQVFYYKMRRLLQNATVQKTISLRCTRLLIIYQCNFLDWFICEH